MATLTEGQVTLDGSGDGTIIFPAPPLHHQWDVERVSVTITGGSGANLGGECRIFRGAPVASNFIDGTETPWLDVATFDEGQVSLFPGQQLRVVFTGCGVGQAANATLEGSQRRQKVA